VQEERRKGNCEEETDENMNVQLVFPSAVFPSRSPVPFGCPGTSRKKGEKTHQTGKTENKVSLMHSFARILAIPLVRVVISCFTGEVAHAKEIKMSLSKRFFLLGSILLMAALLFTFSPKALSAHAASVSASTHSLTTTTSAISANAFSCPSRSICFYQNEDGTGQSKSCLTRVCRGAWYSTTVGGQHAGSVFDNSNSIFWVANKQFGFEVCEAPGTYNLFHSYGYYWVEYGVTSCNGALVPPLP
jgi:hypothetical protein